METSAEVEGLSLYQFSSCPFCSRVLMAIRDLGVQIRLCDVLTDRDCAREVVEATGRSTVPVLRIEEADGTVRWMFESADIIAYLQDRFA